MYREEQNLMMEKEKKIIKRVNHRLLNSRRRISISLLLSNLSILIVPLLALIVIYSTASKLLLQVQKENVSSALSTAVIALDRQFEESYNVGRYISNDNQLLKLCRMNDGRVKKSSYYDMYLITSHFPNYNLTNKIIQNVYLFFRDQDYVIKLPTLVPAKENAYRTLDFVGGLSYEECLEQYTSRYYEGEVQHITSDIANGSQTIMAQSFPYGTVGQPYGVIIFLLDQSIIREQLQASLGNDEGMSLIYDQKGNIIQTVSGKNCILTEEDLSFVLNGQNGISQQRINGVNYVVCTRMSEYTRWNIVSLISKSELLHRIGYMRYAIIFLSIVSVCVALFICIYTWRRRLGILGRYCDFHTTLTGEEEEFRGFWESFHMFLDNVTNLQKTMKLQEKLLKSEVIRKILYNQYETSEDMQEELDFAGISLAAEYYCVVVLKMNDNIHSTDSRMKETRPFLQEYLQKQLTKGYLMCDINYHSVALVILNPKKRETEVLRDIFYQLIVTLQEQYGMQMFIGLSDELESQMELYRAFSQAVKVSDYLKYYNLRMPMTEKELPVNTKNFYFPIELELRFVKSIRKGKAEELEKIIEEIQRENIDKRKLNMIMLSHLTDMVRCTSIRVLKEYEMTEIEERIHKIEHATTLVDIFTVIVDAKRIINGEVEARVQDANLELKLDIENYINEQYSNCEFNISMLAEYVNMSENKLYQEFKNCFGVTLSEYLENIRITKACQLLKANVTVKNVADMVGYSSDYSFRRAFKRVLCVSPSNYGNSDSQASK
jgi:two-component system response regulator YesN